MIAAWEVHPDGTVWPLAEVLGRSTWPGHWRVRRTDGTVVSVYGPNLRAADNIDLRYTGTTGA